MSCNPETIVLVGYRIPKDVAHEIIDNLSTETFYDYEDMFIDTDPYGDQGDYFFGSVLTTIRPDDEPIKFDSILATHEQIIIAQAGFLTLFGDYYATHKELVRPDYEKYIFMRYD